MTGTLTSTHVRDELFDGALEQIHVDGQSVILAVWEYSVGGTPMTDERWLAYMLATTYHETAHRMWPITEYGSQSYLQGKEYYPYIGRGFVQLTWEDNYRKASSALGLIDERDLVDHPEMALDWLIATRCLFRGMAEGWFTGQKTRPVLQRRQGRSDQRQADHQRQRLRRPDQGLPQPVPGGAGSGEDRGSNCVSEPQPPPNGRAERLINAAKGLSFANVVIIALLVLIAVPVYVVYKALGDEKIMDRLLSTYEEIDSISGCSVRHVQERGGPDLWGVSSGFAFQGADRWYVNVLLQRPPTDSEIESYCQSLKLIADRMLADGDGGGGEVQSGPMQGPAPDGSRHDGVVPTAPEAETQE